MKIKVNNTEVEAYKLLMRKPYAEAIANGSKTVEIRDFSDFYHKMFVDKEKEKAFNKYLENPDGSMGIDDIVREDITHIRFTNYNQSWHLDVEIYPPHIISPADEEDVKFIRESYGFNGLDDEPAKFKNLTDEDEVPMIFAIPIARVINRENI
ncbi:hypothetical protein [Riemerella anatipestifer]|uniref:hypothetical protein n=1 Tax=Riemerella anatipestifer TaxID=34085 RepID=UPI001BD943F3|nr:hypothetical protein [Riemerella anatipestifer]MBT0554274.1 hypothetical protein [Riemerella anatipestifer]MCE3024989.1 hypothetical protein [Riemerella anatipestifer]MDY3449823.1 hypothetical protein [Riemerella anatipestifer]QYR03357.1 hypothetical protein J6M00_02755 [Riemerella anatipestifer]QYR05626.1 hypothetical protein J6M09_02995 [Riemerella anatipestifer]